MKQIYRFLVVCFLAIQGTDAKERLELHFKPVAPPQTEQEKYLLKSTDEVTINKKKQKIGFTTLISTGYWDNGEVYGLLKDRYDHPLTLRDGSPYICNGTSNPFGSGSGLDHVSLLQKNGRLYMVSQFECQVGAYYINELQQDTQGGLHPKPGTLRYISQKEEFGGYVHCAGMKTPWESHLGSEEYPADAKLRKKDGSLDPYYDYIADYWGGDLAQANPYYYGWVPELSIDDRGEVDYTKHYSMGRLSHELAYVMPDRKTVYLSDDGTNVGFFRYVAKRAEDLSKGTLYAAKWDQVSSEKGGSATLSWIELGSAKDSEIRAMLDPDHNVSTNDGLTFSDIFEEGMGEGACKPGYTSINTESGFECLRVKKGMQKAAAFLETRRYAAMMGATTEFRKGEGITFDAGSHRLYFSISEIGRGMEDHAKKGNRNSQYDQGGFNHIRLPYNRCGGVYALSVDETYRAVSMKAELVGKPFRDGLFYRCEPGGIANPDNITFLPNSSILVIGEDSSYHENNRVWAYHVDTKQLQPIIILPKGAEATSPFWYNDINGYGYLVLVTQHPHPKSEKRGESSVGVLGPFRGLTQ
ncbi:MAG: alkaline phosphatase PhoX [Sulfurimonas sp.]